MQWPLTGRDAELRHARALIDSGRGFALVGAAGVGKSRLLHEIIDRTPMPGTGRLQVVATEATRSVPFAPFATLLPPEPTQDRTDLFRRVLERMQEVAESGSVLLAVDDAQHLDDGSLALVATAIATGTATVCLTARTGAPMEAALVDLWTNGIIERIELEPLDETLTGSLIEATLGTVEPSLVRRLWEVTGGNPLVLHELVEGAAGRTMRQDPDGTWRYHGRLAKSPRLADLIRSRTEQIPDDLRHALELVSVGTPLPIAILERVAGDVVSRLESTGLVTIQHNGNDMVATPSHPLHGDALEANLGETRRRQAYRELVEAAVGIPGSCDALQVAVWQYRAGTTPYPDLAVDGAAQALVRHDPALAEDLARPVAAHHPQAAVILGRALSYQLRPDEAEAVLAAIPPDEPSITADLASARAHNLAYGLDRVSAAVRILEDAGRIVDGASQARLDTERAILSAIRGDFDATITAGRAVIANEAASVAAKTSAHVTLTLGLAITADCDGFDAIADTAYRLAARTRDELPLAQEQIGVIHLSALTTAGRVDEAVALGRRHVERTDGTALASTWLDAMTLPLDLAGQLRDALAAATAARAGMDSADPFRLEPQARGLSALERGQLGDPNAGDDVAGIGFSLPEPRLSIWVGRGRVWAAAATGRTDEAAEMAAAQGRIAIEQHHISWGALALHDAVRLGRAELVVEDLGALRDDRGAHLVTAMADHAAASHAGAGEGLLAVAERFAAMGAPLLAAEAAAQAALILPPAASSLAACLSRGWEARCQDPVTPALGARPDTVSEREFEVALDAARGETSADIARLRFISVRTVDNHLRSVYRKLGIGGREELRAVLAPLTTHQDHAGLD
jgi:DNA-binding CsgD family transcriptional regulator